MAIMYASRVVIYRKQVNDATIVSVAQRLGLEVCTVIGTTGIPRGNRGNGDHIHGNTVGMESYFTRLLWRWGAMLTVIPQ